MDFDDTPEEAAFRAEARKWLASTGAPRASGSVGLGVVRSSEDVSDDEHVRRCKRWQRTLFDGGWAGITWPTEFGGRGGTPFQQLIFDQEVALYDIPRGLFAVSIGMVGPTLIAHGSRAQQARHLRSMLRGDEVWCQLFSEPDGGSDLASLTTRAERTAQGWVVNGQKVWTSGAHNSDFGILLARTDADALKHNAISCFLVDMTTPGIDVRPLRQITGAAHFNQVFLQEVHLPEDAVVGDINGGWRIARTTLTSERALIGGISKFGLADVAALARSWHGDSSPVRRQALAAYYTRLEVLRYLGLRVQTALSHGRSPGAEASVMKLAYSLHVAATSDLVVALPGAAGTLAGDDAPGRGQWHQYFLNQWSSRIGGGTDQIQRNVIAERALGLPRDLVPDRHTPLRPAT